MVDDSGVEEKTVATGLVSAGFIHGTLPPAAAAAAASAKATQVNKAGNV